ncbi:MAG TPA: MFS transporter [Rhabdochlamydiaceae bacterium]|jgi:predicted MFS family arabinose efflux permease
MTSSLSTSRALTWALWIVASIFYAYQYVLRVMPNILLNDIMQQFHVDVAFFGQFSGVYYVGYSLMHLPIGMMLDRYGPKKVLSICILLTVAGLSPLIFASHWIFPLLGRILIGIGSSAAILGVFKIIRMAFKAERFPRMLSLSSMIGLIGAIYGGGPVNYMREAYGYQAVVYLFALAGVALALLTYFILPNSQKAPQASAISQIKEVLGKGRVIWACLCAGLMVGPLEGFADVWGTAFLKQVFGLEASLAASLPSLIFIGMCFGSPLLNLIAEKAGNYLLTIIGTGIAMALGFTLLLACPWTSSLLSLNFGVIGMCCAYQILAIYKVSTYVREEIAGVTTAIANMIIMIFGYVFHTLMGGIIQALGGPSNATALSFGVSVIPIALTLGTLGFALLFLREKKELSMQKSI